MCMLVHLCVCTCVCVCVYVCVCVCVCMCMCWACHVCASGYMYWSVCSSPPTADDSHSLMFKKMNGELPNFGRQCNITCQDWWQKVTLSACMPVYLPLSYKIGLMFDCCCRSLVVPMQQ